MPTKELVFRVGYVIKPDDERFVAYCPLLKGCFTWGYTFEEAEKNIRELIPQFLAVLIEHQDPIPVGVLTRHPRRTKRSTSEAAMFDDDFAVPCPA